MTSSLLSLLGVNPGVENLIILFVSSGDGGLRSILNLRLVCSTTKEWVDNLPKTVADVVFSRAQVKLDIEYRTVQEFLFYPPPFGVTALSLAEECVIDDEDSSDAEDACDRFCEFWHTKLETLELRNELESDQTVEGFRMELLESPNLHTLHFSDDLVVPEQLNFPSCFQKVRELHVRSVCLEEDEIRNQFFTQLKNNVNLEVFSVNINCGESAMDNTQLINHKKEDRQLQLIFTLELECGFSGSIFREFVLSVIASKSKIRLNVQDLGKLKKRTDKYLRRQPRSVCLELFKMVESAKKWKPTKSSFSLLENFPRLKKLYGVNTGDLTVNLDGVTFPSSLEELEVIEGFPSCANLPESLTSLRLCQLNCHINILFNYLNMLSHRCPQLKRLFISNWKSVAEEGRAVWNFQNKSDFLKLRKFTLTGKLLKTDHMKNCRNAITNAFDWSNLELRSLSVKLLDSDGRHLPLVDGEVLRHLHEGNSARSLEKIEIEDDCVTPGALQLLQTLNSLASKNPKSRLKRQGH